VKRLAENRFGIDPRQCTVAATHAHHAPEILGEEYVDNRHQVERLIKGCSEAIESCMADLEPARIGWGDVAVASAINRFQWRTGGEAVKRVDRRVDLLRICHPDGTHRGLLWHYAAHPTVALRADYLISRDYYGEVNDIVGEALGGFCMFMQGACANINLTVHERSFEKVHHHATHIADRILQVAPSIEAADAVELDSDAVEIDSPITSRIAQIEADSDPGEVRDYFQSLDRMTVDHTRRGEEFAALQAMRRRAHRLRLWEDFIIPGRSCERVRLQTFRIGDRLGLTIPGEPFVELQLELQRAFPDHRAMVFGYANGHIGYIPDPDSFETETYETAPTYMKRAGKESGALMVRSGIEMLETLLSAD
jgi:hypothetical protein